MLTCATKYIIWFMMRDYVVINETNKQNTLLCHRICKDAIREKNKNCCKEREDQTSVLIQRWSNYSCMRESIVWRRAEISLKIICRITWMRRRIISGDWFDKEKWKGNIRWKNKNKVREVATWISKFNGQMFQAYLAISPKSQRNIEPNLYERPGTIHACGDTRRHKKV